MLLRQTQNFVCVYNILMAIYLYFLNTVILPVVSIGNENKYLVWLV